MRRFSMYGGAPTFLALEGPFAYLKWVGSPSLATPMTATEAAQWAEAARSENRAEEHQPHPIEAGAEISPDTMPEGWRNFAASRSDVA